MIGRIDRMRHDDRGMNLVELMVAMALLSILGAGLVGTMRTASRSLRTTDDEARGQEDVKPVAERLARDIRGARSVDASSTATSLTIWIDSNSDYQHATSENVTWFLEAIPGDSYHFRVVRQATGGTAKIEARTLVSNLAFTYDFAPPLTKLVSVAMQYDQTKVGGTSKRFVQFQTRLRNVG